MPFRDPETGKRFNTIRDAVENYRCPGPCADCPLGQKVGGINGCVNGKWFNDHPIEAARLMGYEVIDDKEVNMDKQFKWEAGDKAVITGNHNQHQFAIGEMVELIRKCEKCEWRNIWECKDQSETNMWYVFESDMRPLTNKEREGLGPSTTRETEASNVDVGAGSKPARPRLAELLGVEVGERFCVKDHSDDSVIGPFFIKSDGFMVWENDPDATSDGAIYIAINHPENIVRATLTEPEIATMRALGAKWVSRDFYCDEGSVDLWREKPTYDNGMYVNTTGVIASVYDAELFPSVKPGACIGVEEAAHALKNPG